jgi:hypothetical protein
MFRSRPMSLEAAKAMIAANVVNMIPVTVSAVVMVLASGG